jgi:drug/metabolite transporter (DMT)-like permease
VFLSTRSNRDPAAWTTHAALFLVQIAFASQVVEAKLLMLPRARGGEELFPEALAMSRMIGSAIFFQALALRPQKPSAAQTTESTRLGGTMHAKLAGLGAIGIALNQTLFIYGLRESSPFVASILGATIPVLTAALAVLLRKERATWRTAGGLSLSFSGVLWLTGVGSGGAHDAGGVDRGAILVALNSVASAVYFVLSRDVVRALGSIRVMAWIFTYGALLFAPLGMSAFLTELPLLSSRGALLLAYIVIVPTIVGYAVNAWALARTSASLVTIYVYIQPLVAGVLARVQLGASVSSRAGVAALLILGGVAVTTVRRRA